jgi:hypothetical protein
LSMWASFETTSPASGPVFRMFVSVDPGIKVDLKSMGDPPPEVDPPLEEDVMYWVCLCWGSCGGLLPGPGIPYLSMWASFETTSPASGPVFSLNVSVVFFVPEVGISSIFVGWNWSFVIGPKNC